MRADALSVDALSVDALSVDALSVDALSVDALSVDALSVDASNGIFGDRREENEGSRRERESGDYEQGRVTLTKKRIRLEGTKTQRHKDTKTRRHEDTKLEKVGRAASGCSFFLKSLAFECGH